MARIKVRFELNKGRIGAPLGKLGDISRQAEKFLRSLANDVKFGVKAEEWLAVNFRNRSVSYDAEFQGEITPADVDAFNRNLEFLADYVPGSEGANGRVPQTTALEFAKLGTVIDPDEVIGLGIYSRERSKPIWRRISYSRTAEMRASLGGTYPSARLCTGDNPFVAERGVAPVFQSSRAVYLCTRALLFPDASLRRSHRGAA